MIPPGLTCATCHQPFRRALARRTREGWVHARRWVCRRGVQVREVAA